MTGNAIDRFWFGLSISPARLALFRIAFFGVLGVDAFLQIAHAPRYGFGGFNVPHFDVGGIAPGRELMLTAYAVQAYLAFRIAAGSVSRIAIGGLAILWGATYFVSQLDSYQHHYLVFLVLIACSLFPWRGGSAWGVRLLLCQISIVYLFAAIAKLEPSWVDGNTLVAQVSAGWLRDRMASIGWNVAAMAIIATELALAIAIQIRRLQPIAAIVGIAFHLAIELAGFRIGLFTYFMIAFYLLLVPESWYMPVTARLSRWQAPAVLSARGTPALVLALGLAVAGAALLFALPLPAIAPAAAIVAAAGAAAVLANRHRPVPTVLGHVVACALVLVTALTTDAARDYHRYWASALRDAGHPEEALPIYERAVAIDPDFGQGHTSLGNLYHRLGRDRDALAEYERAQALDPDNWRAHAGEAIAADSLGDRDRARDAARRTLERNPGQRDARRILDSP